MAPPVAPVLEDRYELGDEVGRGAIGVVHRGWDRRLGRPVAVKCLRRELAADPDIRARFEEEARAAAGLAHHRIVTVYDTGEADGIPFIVMECLAGRTLADRIAEEGALAPVEVAAIGRHLAAAVAVAHAAGVLHRDIKPANILLDEHGGVKLADFGIAKSAESAVDLTLTGTIIGSPAYLAPERLAGSPATVASDVYALGVVLREAATGERPFRGDTPVAVAHDIHTRVPTPLAEAAPGLPAPLAAAIDRAMAREPGDRPPSAEALGDLFGDAAVPPAPDEADGAPAPGGGDTQVAPVAGTTTTVVALDDLDDLDERTGRAGRAPGAARHRHRRSGPDGGPSGAGADRTPPAPALARTGSRFGASALAFARRAPIAVVAVAVVLLVAVGWALGRGGGIEAPAAATTTAPPTTAPAAPEASLPPALDDAFDALDEAVDP